MDFPDRATIAFVVGSALTVVGLVGGDIHIREIGIRKLSITTRIVVVVAGLAFIGLSTIVGGSLPSDLSFSSLPPAAATGDKQEFLVAISSKLNSHVASNGETLGKELSAHFMIEIDGKIKEQFDLDANQPSSTKAIYLSKGVHQYEIAGSLTIQNSDNEPSYATEVGGIGSFVVNHDDTVYLAETQRLSKQYFLFDILH
jgi:hypothetical protein